MEFRYYLLSVLLFTFKFISYELTYVYVTCVYTLTYDNRVNKYSDYHLEYSL